MQFYGYFRSSAAYRCRIALNLKDLPYEFVSVHLRRDGGEQKKAGYRQLNPQGLVPALRTDDGAVLTQSLAIIEWLDEFHREPPLMPSEATARAHVRAFAQAIACDIHPLQNLRVLEQLKQMFAADQSVVDVWCRHWIGTGLEACETLVPGDGPYCFGSRPGLADICLVPQIFSARRFGYDLSNVPRLVAIEAACQQLPAFANAHPDRQPDTED